MDGLDVGLCYRGIMEAKVVLVMVMVMVLVTVTVSVTVMVLVMMMVMVTAMVMVTVMVSVEVWNKEVSLFHCFKPDYRIGIVDRLPLCSCSTAAFNIAFAFVSLFEASV